MNEANPFTILSSWGLKWDKGKLLEPTSIGQLTWEAKEPEDSERSEMFNKEKESKGKSSTEFGIDPTQVEVQTPYTNVDTRG